MEKLYLTMMIVLPAIIPTLLFAIFKNSGTFATRMNNVVTLDPINGLLHQRFFWLCIVVPISYFLTFGFVAWSDHSINLSAEGLTVFLSISTLPLGLLSISLPLTVIAASFHSTQQTARQIEHANLLHIQEQIRQRAELERTVINTLTLIKIELHEAWSIYFNEYGKPLLETAKNQPFLCTYPLGENLFPIYDSAPACLADAPTEISGEIVRTYMRTKGLVTTINLNNEKTVTAINRARIEHDKVADEMRKDNIEPSAQTYEKLKTIYESSCDREARILGMVDDANSMRNITTEVSKSIISIIEKLDKHIYEYYLKRDAEFEL